jgi:hypothetical protein
MKSYGPRRFTFPASDLIRLRHMLDAAREAVTHGTGRTASDLAQNRMLALALINKSLNYDGR